MLNILPKITVPITSYTTYTETLVGKVTGTKNSTCITGHDTKFTVQCSIGSVLIQDDIIIGYIGNILNDTLMYLDDIVAESFVSTTAVVQVFDPSNLGTPTTITDIFRRVVASETYTKYTSALMPYRVKDGETIESVSQQFYRSPFYHWVVIVMNNITQPWEEWPITESQLAEKIVFLHATPITGVVTSTQNSTIVTGVDTQFTAELKIGDMLYEESTNKEIGRISTIVSNTHLTLIDVAPNTYSGICKYCNTYDTYEYREVDTHYVVEYDAVKLLNGDIYEISIYDYEHEKNDAKRLIKILNPAYISDFVAEYTRLISR